MKKKIINTALIMIVIFLTGCAINNNPTSKVEELLSKYQMLDKDISTSYTLLTTDTKISQDLKEEYQKLIKKQYQNLSYEIKEETIDGDTATITTQIKVIDYKSTIDKYLKTDYTNEDYHKKIIESLKNIKETITYTIDFTVTKDTNGNWKADELDTIQKEKLLGMN